MPQKRQVDEEALFVRSLALDHGAGARFGAHAHAWAQLVYASEGVLEVRADGGAWVVPSERAIWIPAGLEHELLVVTRAKLRTLYLRPDLVDRLPAASRVLGVSPLLRELVLHIVAGGWLDAGDPEQARLARVLVDQLAPMRSEPALDLPLPSDERARVVAARVQAEPGERVSLALLSRGSGASARTIERLFRAETGLTFGHWRQRVRLLESLRRLAAGESVTQVAFAVGYEQTSAFIAMFKRALGRTPGKYFG